MNVGWLCYGFFHRNRISVDGGTNYRIPIMKRLIERGDKLHWLGAWRGQEEIDQNFITLGGCAVEFQKLWGKLRREQNISTNEYKKKFVPKNLPDIDVLIVESNMMGLQAVYMACVINYYIKKKKIKVIIWDLDCIQGAFYGHLKTLNLNYGDFEIWAPYSTKKYLRQRIAYSPYVPEHELPIKKGINICYVGNNYQREKELKRFYDTPLANIYGKWVLKELTEDDFKCKFMGRVTPNEVHRIINKHLLSIQITRPIYSQTGAMPERVNEVLESGTILLADKNIKDIDYFIDEKFLIENGDDVKKLYSTISNWSERKYKHEVRQQREKVKEIANFKNILKWIKK